MSNDSKYLELINELHTSKRCDNQLRLISYLKERDYKFFQASFIKEVGFSLELKKKSHKKFIFLTRVLQETTNPLKDRYDFNVLVGICLDHSTDKVLIYLEGKYYTSLSLGWPLDTKVNFKSVKGRKFPKEMSLDDRFKWRQEDYKLIRDPRIKSSDFYNEWAPKIKELQEESK